MNYPMIAAIFFGIIVLSLLSYIIHTANDLARKRNRVQELDADVDVALTNRYDLLKKQYDAVKKYCSYENQTLLQTIRLRSGMSVAEKQAAETGIRKLSKQLQVTMEAYPQLQSSQNVLQLQRNIEDAEGHLQAARRLYNAGVTDYNNKCVEFPSSVIAGICGYRKAEYYKAEAGKRNDVENQS